MRTQDTTNCYFLILARDEKHVEQKIKELSKLEVPYLIVCGEKLDLPGVVHRPAIGKYDAINFGVKLIPKDVEIVAMNDVDTRIHGFNVALSQFKREEATLLFTKVIVSQGPQNLFLSLQDRMRRHLLMIADGDLMLIKRNVLSKVLPLKPCKAEDTYILFKVLEYKGKATFCEECYCTTSKAKNVKDEELYKRRTVNGLYQALHYTNPPFSIKLIYILLPFLSPLLMIMGVRGYYWMRGILLGFVDYLRGDRGGAW